MHSSSDRGPPILHAMGFIRDTIHNHQMKDPVLGQGLVVDISDWMTQTRTPYSLQATLVVQAQGLSKVTVQHSEIVNNTSPVLERWPAQGDTIPVTIDRADPSRLQIEWNEIPSKRDLLQTNLSQRAEARKQELLAQAYGEDGQEGAPKSEVKGASLDPELEELMRQEEEDRNPP